MSELASASPGRAAATATPQTEPTPALDGGDLGDRLRGVRGQRDQAAEQISRTLRVWRKAAGGEGDGAPATEIQAPIRATIHRTAQGNVKDSGVVQAGQKLVDDKKADDMEDALEQLLAAARQAGDSAQVKKIEGTQKGFGFKGSRKSKGGKKR